MGLIKTLTIEGTTYDIGVKTDGGLRFNENYGTLELLYDSTLKLGVDNRLGLQLDSLYGGLECSNNGLHLKIDRYTLATIEGRLAVNLAPPSMYNPAPHQIGRGICAVQDEAGVYGALSLFTTISPEYIIDYTPLAVHRDGPVVLPIDPQSAPFFTSNEYGLVFNSGYLITYLKYNIKVDLTTGEITTK